MTQIKKILVIAPSWVGDLVMTQSLLRLIKEQNPGCLIDVFANKFLHPILQRMPEVANCLVSPFQHNKLELWQRFKVGKNLRANFYDHAYVLPNSFKSALVPFWAKIPLRTGWRGEMRYFLLNDIRILSKEKLPLMVERFVALGNKEHETTLKSFSLPELQVSPEQLKSTVSRLKISISEKPILALCPGAEYGIAKRWPPSYFAEVAKRKKAEGWEIWIFGDAKDRLLAEEIQNECGNICCDFTGKTDLGEAIDLLSLANVVVTNDSGLMHIAAALSRPLVAIYGSSSFKHTPPLTKNKLETLSLNLPCSPCFKRKCPLNHTKCLYDLQPELVLQAIALVSR